jgi:protein-tyrosine-phosphatase
MRTSPRREAATAGDRPDAAAAATPSVVPTPPVVLFVCQHGAAKSVLAAAELERLAAGAGIQISVRAAGVEPEAAVAPAVLALLPEKAAVFGRQRPRRINEQDIGESALTITFNLLASDLPATPRRTLAWDDVPSVSERPGEAREAIDRHLVALLETMR